MKKHKPSHYFNKKRKSGRYVFRLLLFCQSTATVLILRYCLMNTAVIMGFFFCLQSELFLPAEHTPILLSQYCLLTDGKETKCIVTKNQLKGLAVPNMAATTGYSTAGRLEEGSLCSQILSMKTYLPWR